MNVIYSVPNIPDNTSTSRYNHALSIAFESNISILVTNSPPPEDICEEYDKICVLNRINDVRGVIENSRQILRIVKHFEKSINRDFMFVTTFHYAQALSGYISNQNWIIDIYDDPMQLSIRRSVYSLHQISSRFFLQMMRKADGVISTLHPAGPRSSLGQQTRYSLNGSPVSTISPDRKQSCSSLRCVWVGKTQLGLGIEILLRSLKQTQADIIVDIYGEPIKHAELLANDLDVCDKVNFHGNVSHKQVCSAIENSHVGLCVLSPHIDFKYSYPIKICEYLAGGTIPIVSDYPGHRMLADEAAIYTEPNPNDLATSLDEVGSLSERELSDLMLKSRRRGEKISWRKERKRFRKHLLSLQNSL